MKIYNLGSSDRLGANTTYKLIQIIYALKHNYNIEHENIIYYEKSIFTIALLDLIKYTNNYIIKYQGDEEKILRDKYLNWEDMFLKVIVNLKQDFLSYFNETLKTTYYNLIKNYADFKFTNFNKNDWNKSICIHLRLDDVNFNNRIDYNGYYSSSFFINKINNNDDKWNLNELYNHYKNNNIFENLNLYDAQSPISEEKILELINKLQIKYPNHKIKIIKSPIGICNLNFDIYNSLDPDFDLWCMIHSDILVLSRSTYSLLAACLHQGSQIYSPLWGHFASTGMSSKYDKSNIIYFET